MKLRTRSESTPTFLPTLFCTNFFSLFPFFYVLKHLLVFVFLWSLLPCVAWAESSGIHARLERISSAQESEQDWIWAVRELVDTKTRTLLQDAIRERENYPRQQLVNLLSHSILAVRLGALELLEQAAGKSFAFNPWLKSGDEMNQDALRDWQKWAGLTDAITTDGPTLSPEQMQSYLRDIISGNSDRKNRAIRMLHPHALKAVAAIQGFLAENSALPRSNVLSLKEAQYHLVLNRKNSKNASLVARDLTRGNRDQQLVAIAGLKQAGFLAIPIVRDFVEAQDPLIRETAIDTILGLGGRQVLPLVMPALLKEKDTNVIHAAMRRFREIGGSGAVEMALGHLEHESEDMIVSALKTLTKLLGSDSSRRSGSKDGKLSKEKIAEIDQQIVVLLNDPRWRVRSAVLEFMSETRNRAADEKVISLLADEDSFVRSHAINTVVALRLKTARPALEKLFLEDDEMIAPVTSAFTSMEIPLPDHLIVHLDSRPADIIVGAIKGLDSDKEKFLKITTRYATHENLDVACATLRSLSDDRDKVKKDFVADYLSSALLSGSDEKIDAVLNTIRLPRNTRRSYSRRLPPSGSGGETSLDSLYDAFLTPLSGNQPKSTDSTNLDPAKGPKVKGGLNTLKTSITQFLNQWESHGDRSFRAAYVLAKADESLGLVSLMENFSQLTTSQRAAAADDLYNLKSKEATPLLTALLQDDLSKIRKDAATSCFSEEKNWPLMVAALAELDKKDGKLMANEVYSYRFENALKKRNSRKALQGWARKKIASEAPDQIKILALIILRKALKVEDEKVVTPYTRSPNRWLRRAAWFSLLKSRPDWVRENMSKLVSDSAPQVRLALPMSFNKTRGTWKHFFSDLHQKKDQYWSSQTRSPKLSAVAEAQLREMAENDADITVRFESWFALMSHRKTIDLDAFIDLIPQQSKDVDVADRLANHLEKNYKYMGAGMRPLLAYANVKEISKSDLPKLLKHFAPKDKAESSFSSFADLAKSSEVSKESQQVADVEDPADIAARRQHLKVIVFYKPGCKQCEKAESHLEDLKDSFPLLELDRRNILDQDDLLFNRALCDRFQVSGAGKTPSFFAQAGAAIAPNVEPAMLAELLVDTMEMPDDSSWAIFEEEEMVEAKQAVEETFSNITLLIVILGGLFDGVNPCAFATIIFFLSYLQVAKRTPREILMVGCSFILAIFLAYFSVGLVFHAAIEKLTELKSFQWARMIMTWVFAFFALLVAVLSLRDGIRARRGSLKEMTLQLPEFLKNRIRGTIRKRARARNYVVAAFVTGIIISFLELACTGQVYAPIVYQIQQGRADAMLYLLIYNIAFILPLVVIFLLAYRGMTSEALLKFQKNHTAAVKFATAALFFLLTIVILFGDRLLSHA